jgi:hypothetical protein
MCVTPSLLFLMYISESAPHVSGSRRQAQETDSMRQALGLKSELADLSMDGQAQLLQSLAKVGAVSVGEEWHGLCTSELKVFSVYGFHVFGIGFRRSKGVWAFEFWVCEFMCYGSMSLGWVCLRVVRRCCCRAR